MTRTFIGIGSNLADPVAQVTLAIDELAQLPDSVLVSASSLYRSAPMGPPEQPDYINACVELASPLSPQALLECLQRLEQAHYRINSAVRWGPRTLDLDLLVYGQQRINEPGLVIPHPGIAERIFVLKPLLEIAPGLTIPGIEDLTEALIKCADDGNGGIERLDEQN